MAVMLAQASLETSLTRLNDDGRTLLFTEARTANTVSDRPVTGGKVRLLPHLQPGNVGKATQAPVNAILAVDSAFHHQIPRLFPAPGCGTLSKQTQGCGTRSAPAAHGCLSARRAARRRLPTCRHAVHPRAAGTHIGGGPEGGLHRNHACGDRE
jgi:hypothetical protein